jgi:hypothetical protein
MRVLRGLFVGKLNGHKYVDVNDTDGGENYIVLSHVAQWIGLFLCTIST